MSKIVQAVNAMISNPGLIDNVSVGFSSDEFFFMYKGKYKWSMKKLNDIPVLYFYPGEDNIENLLGVENWDNVEFTYYNPLHIGTKEAKSSFLDLYTLLSERASGIDDVLNDIISDVDF